MNLAYKALVVCLIAVTLKSYAEDKLACATIQLEQSEDYILSIFKVDSRPVTIKKNYRKMMSGRSDYKIAPGEHVITFLQYPKSYFQLSRSHFAPRASGKGAVDIKMKVVHLAVEADHRIKLGLSDNVETAMLNLVEQKSEICRAEDPDELISFNNTVFEDRDPLPENLDNRLVNIMERINLYHKMQLSNETNVLPLSMDEYFGGVVDQSYSRKNYIRVLSVLPFSFAAKLGLKSGDLIIKLGKMEIDPTSGEPREVLDNYLTDLNYDWPVIIQVLRNNKVIDLQKKKRLPIIPSSQYYFESASTSATGLTNTKSLDPQLTFKYQQLILALHDYYRSKNVDTDKVRIFHGASPSKSLGIKGKELPGVGIQILSVAEHSPMSKLGVRENDIILHINNQELMTDSAEILLSEMKSWKEADKISLVIKRNGQEQQLDGLFEPSTVPAFSLAFDMNSEKYISEYQKKYLKSNRWPYQIRTATWSPGGGYKKHHSWDKSNY